MFWAMQAGNGTKQGVDPYQGPDEIYIVGFGRKAARDAWVAAWFEKMSAVARRFRIYSDSHLIQKAYRGTHDYYIFDEMMVGFVETFYKEANWPMLAGADDAKFDKWPSMPHGKRKIY